MNTPKTIKIVVDLPEKVSFAFSRTLLLSGMKCAQNSALSCPESFEIVSYDDKNRYLNPMRSKLKT